MKCILHPRNFSHCQIERMCAIRGGGHCRRPPDPTRRSRATSTGACNRHPTTRIRLTYPMRFACAACNHVQLNSVPESKERWTIVTSATSFYAPLALKMAGIDSPPTIVTSEHVRYVCDFADSFNDALPLTAFVTDCLCIARAISRGKPFPDPYLEGAKRCGVDPRKTLVVEDAPSGIRSGKACGAKTLAVLTSHDKAQMVGSGAEPDYIVDNLFAWVVRSKPCMSSTAYHSLNSQSFRPLDRWRNRNYTQRTHRATCRLTRFVGALGRLHRTNF